MKAVSVIVLAATARTEKPTGRQLTGAGCILAGLVLTDLTRPQVRT